MEGSQPTFSRMSALSLLRPRTPWGPGMWRMGMSLPSKDMAISANWFMETISSVPRFSGLSKSDIMMRRMPSTQSSTYMKERVCSPSPHTSKSTVLATAWARSRGEDRSVKSAYIPWQPASKHACQSIHPSIHPSIPGALARTHARTHAPCGRRRRGPSRGRPSRSRRARTRCGSCGWAEGYTHRSGAAESPVSPAHSTDRST